VLVGPYDRLPSAWGTLLDWCAKEGLALAGVNWQVYDEGDPENNRTSLYALLA
jgi:effector-binding domain-containing protein